MKNIALYIRVSTEDQVKEGYPPRFAIANLIRGTGSLEVQGESSPDFFEIKAGRTMYLEDFAKREDLEVFKVYQDDGISGYFTERPALKSLLKDDKEKKFELI